MAINWNVYSIRDLSGGMKWDSSPFKLEKTALKYIVNFNTDKEGMFEKETGYAQHGDGIVGATNIRGLTPFYYGTNQKFIAAVDSGSAVDMYVFDPGDGSWDTQSLSLTTAFNYEFSTFLDGLFAVNFTDSTYFYDGSTWSTTTNLTNAPKAKYVISYGERLYMAYVDIGGTTHPSRVVASELPDDSYNITWDTSNTGLYFDVSPKDGDEIKGLGRNFNRLLIFKEESLWRYDTNTLYQISGAPGTNNNRTIANVLGWTIYFHKTGIYGVNQDYGAVKLSRDIQPFIEGVSSTSLDKLCAYANGDNYIIYLGDVYNSYDKIDIPRCVAILNVKRNKWRIGQLMDRPSVFAHYRDDRSDITYDETTIDYDYYDKTFDGILSADDYFFFGTSDGRIYKLDKETKTQNTYKIRSYFETHNHYPNGIHARWQGQAVKFYMDNAKRAKLAYSIDDGPWKPVVRYEEKPGEIYYQFKNNVWGNRIKFKCSDNSIGERIKIYGIDFFYTPGTSLI